MSLYQTSVQLVTLYHPSVSTNPFDVIIYSKIPKIQGWGDTSIGQARGLEYDPQNPCLKKKILA